MSPRHVIACVSLAAVMAGACGEIIGIGAGDPPNTGDGGAQPSTDGRAVVDGEPGGAIPPDCLPADASAGMLAHTVAGFRDAQAACDWRYMFQADGGAIVDLPLFGSPPSGANAWYQSEFGYPFINVTGAHPVKFTTATTNRMSAIRRWVSNYAGGIVIGGDAVCPQAQYADANYDGVLLRVLHNGNELSTVDLTTNEGKKVQALATVAKGDAIDIIIEPRKESYGDFTNLTITIERASSQ